MSNPFEPPQVNAIPRIDAKRKPWLLCSIVTMGLIPIWFVILARIAEGAHWIKEEDTMTIHLVLSVLACVILIPLNVFLVAPALANLAFPRNARSLVVHFLVTLSTVSIFAAAYYLVPESSLFSIQLGSILIPPMLIGSLCYSFRFNSINIDGGREFDDLRLTAFDDPILGTLQFEAGVGWKKYIDFGEGFVEILIGKENRLPSQAMLKTARKWATEWPNQRNRLADYIHQELKREASTALTLAPDRLVLKSIQVMRAAYPNSCALQVAEDGNPHRNWQISMVGGMPRALREI